MEIGSLEVMTLSTYRIPMPSAEKQLIQSFGLLCHFLPSEKGPEFRVLPSVP